MTENKNLPEPLVPAEIDLRGYEFMPLYGDRLKKSETWIMASAEGKVAALELWWHSYAHEVPAGSLPDNDRLLAQYAGYGSALKAWQAIREEAMRGWILCSDDRWYHKVVADLATEAWSFKVAQRNRTEAARKKRLSQNLSQGLSQHQSQELSQKTDRPVTETVTTSVTASTGQDRTGQDIKTKDQKPPPAGVAEPIFGEWIDFLTRKGIPDNTARTFIGLMRKGYGDELVVEVMAEAERQDITSPKAWISKALQVRSATRGQPPSAASQTTKAMQNLQAMKAEIRE